MRSNRVLLLIGILLLVEPIMFYSSYESSSTLFYANTEHSYDFGPGFGVTVGASISLLISGGLGAAMFCGMVRHLVKTHLRPQVFTEIFFCGICE